MSVRNSAPPRRGLLRLDKVPDLKCVGLLVLLATACDPKGGSSPDPEDADPFVAAHNEVRASVEPAAAPPLPPLTWDDGLAQTAQAWSERCVFEHSSGALGENLAYFSGAQSQARDAVDGWAAEAAFYDYASNACTPGQQCGHYTQLVWRDTARVGCGVAACNLFGAEGFFWVCNYDPPGNYVGERPY